MAAIFASVVSAAYALTWSELINTRGDAVLYLEVRDASNRTIVNRGTGFIVTPAGIVATVQHLEVGPMQRLFGVIGSREGAGLPLRLVDQDVEHDVAVWQLPSRPTPFPYLHLAITPAQLEDTVTPLGFPGERLGLTPVTDKINNLSGPGGVLTMEGNLRPGDSGAPVFDKNGDVVGIAEGGHEGTSDTNQMVSATALQELLAKHRIELVATPAAIDAADAVRHGSLSGQTATVVRTGMVPRTGISVSVDYPPCANAGDEGARQAAQAASQSGRFVLNPLGQAVGRYSSMCVNLCVDIPAGARFKAKGEFDGAYPWKGELPAGKQGTVNPGNWAGIQGPFMYKAKNRDLVCYTYANWSHNLDRPIRLEITYAL